MKRFLLLVACLFCAGSLQARIGETHEQISARYGPPLQRNVVLNRGGLESEIADRHEKNGLEIMVCYDEQGKAAMIQFQPLDKATPLSRADVQTLLDLNGGANATWKQDDALASSGITLFQSQKHDPSLSAEWTHDEMPSKLEIAVFDFAIRHKVDEVRRKEGESKRRLEGF